MARNTTRRRVTSAPRTLDGTPLCVIEDDSGTPHTVGTFTVEDGMLTIQVDLSHDLGTPSTSGKSTVIATTRGNVTVPGVGTIGLNVYRRRR
jgi:hypothetical protein